MNFIAKVKCEDETWTKLARTKEGEREREIVRMEKHLSVASLLNSLQKDFAGSALRSQFISAEKHQQILQTESEQNKWLNDSSANEERAQPPNIEE